MSIRWKLNLSVLAIITVFLTAMLLSMYAVARNARKTRDFARSRELSQFIADVRTGLYQDLLFASDHSAAARAGARRSWIRQVLESIDIQIRLAEAESERALWQEVRHAIVQLDSLDGPVDLQSVSGHQALARAERGLRSLRSFHDLSQYNSIADIARSSLLAQTATTIACLLTVLLFLVYLGIVRRWMIVPIQVLRRSAEIIGRGCLDHRVPLAGRDELGQLARSIDAMAEGLARYQADLVRTRELSALGELCANVAHGLRNPLAAIRSTAQLAERKAAPVPELQSTFHDLAHEADRMDRRITRLFDFSRPQELQIRPTSFSELASAARAQAMPLSRTREVELIVDDGTQGMLWPVDCEQMAQALAELMTNAVHHSPPGSAVVIGGRELHIDGTAVLEMRIVDRGAGMSPSTLAKAFDLFFSCRPDGSGMGLTLVRRLIERHSGTLQLTSAPGEGTICTVCLPGPPIPPRGRDALAPGDNPLVERRNAQPAVLNASRITA